MGIVWDAINWFENAESTDKLADAVKLAQRGLDIGEDATLKLKPTNNNWTAWMQWSALITSLYNRDSVYVKFSCMLQAHPILGF